MTDIFPLGTKQTVENHFAQDTQFLCYEQLLVVKNTRSHCQHTFENLLYLLQDLLIPNLDVPNPFIFGLPVHFVKLYLV